MIDRIMESDLQDLQDTMDYADEETSQGKLAYCKKVLYAFVSDMIRLF